MAREALVMSGCSTPTPAQNSLKPPPEPDRPPLPEVVDAQGRGHDAYEWFDGVKRELELQLPRDTYNTWLRPAELESYEPPG